MLFPRCEPVRHWAEPSGGHMITSPTLDRTEGHTQLELFRRLDKTLCYAHVAVKEPPRYIETLVMGETPDVAARKTSSVCGVCPIVHTHTAHRAARDAAGFMPDERTTALEEIVMWLGTLQSHFAHVAGLVLPDLLGLPAIYGIVDHPAVRSALAVRTTITKLANYLAGRYIHPITLHAAGDTACLDSSKVRELMACVTRSYTYDFARLLELLVEVRGAIPDFGVETAYLSLDTGDYPLAGGEHVLLSTVGRLTARDFLTFVREERVPYSNAYHSLVNGEPYTVGALARWYNHGHKLPKGPRDIARRLGLPEKSMNPFHNTLAQVVECAYMLDALEGRIEHLLTLRAERPRNVAFLVKDAAGTGVSEAPRGTIFHWQLYKNGRVAGARALIPTSQNLAAIERAAYAYLEPLARAGVSDEVLITAGSKLVRGFDPCYSCAVHITYEDEVEEAHGRW